MPIYEYECVKCGRTTEVWQKFSDAPLKTCSSCCGQLQKLISHSSFHLKGTGWYVTDYAGKTDSASPSKKKEDKKTASSAASPKKEE